MRRIFLSVLSTLVVIGSMIGGLLVYARGHEAAT
jgi:hypothetical protein